MSTTGMHAISPQYHGNVVGAPRAIVVVGGHAFSPDSFDVSINNYSASDSATVILAMEGEFQSKNGRPV